MSDESSKGVPDRLKRWLRGAKERGGSFFQRVGLRSKLGSAGRKIKSRFSRGNPNRFEFDLKKVELGKITEHSDWIRWGLIVLAVFLLAEITARTVGLYLRKPFYPPATRRQAPPPSNRFAGGPEYDAILRRNMFNVEGKIPQPFDQGQLDCLSQARPSTQRLQLLGTIVMNDEAHSVALLQEEGNPVKLAVKKEESFYDGKFVAKKVDRKKFCFQVRASGDFEFIEIPDDSAALGLGGPSLGGGTEGITPINDTAFSIKKSFLDEKLLNLNDILQTARAVPYLEPGTGRFMGFLVQSIEPNSPFASLGIRQGDVLTNVNDITLDNPGKGLEAFQRLRNSQKVSLVVIRGGEKKTLGYEVK